MHLFHFALQYILVYFHKMRYYRYIRNYFSYRRSILVGCFPLWDHMRNGSSFNIYETRLLPGFSLLFLFTTELATSSFLIFATQNAHSAIIWQSGHFSYLAKLFLQPFHFVYSKLFFSCNNIVEDHISFLRHIPKPEFSRCANWFCLR